MPDATTSTAPGLSRGMQALWGVQKPGRRGPRRAMSVHDIAAAAIALADADGLEAVTMNSVARALGFTTMSLYRYVDSRADLLAVMVDEAYGPPPEPDRRRGWRSRLHAWAHADADRLRAHPWIVAATPNEPPVGPNLLAWMESGFAALEPSGLSAQPLASALLTVDGYVRSSVEMGLRYGAPGATEGWAPAMRAVLDEHRFPAITAVLASGAFEDGGDTFATDEFDFGLDLVLTGIAQLVARAGGSTAPGR